MTQIIAIVVPVIVSLFVATAWLSSQIATIRASMITRDVCDRKRETCPARIELGIEHSKVHAIDSRGGA